ncbi:MAG: nitrate reductase molybdenum cofactor assembly chaperone [Candidatus Nanopelagicales bacterium]
MSRPDVDRGHPEAEQRDVAAARLCASWLLTYPDDALLTRLDDIAEVVGVLPPETGEPLRAFLAHVADTPVMVLQQHFVQVFDMRRRACPYLSYWTDGETRNRGRGILKFREAYVAAGFTPSNDELPDHLAVVLEFAAVGDRLTGDALLAEFNGPIHLLRDALDSMGSAYVHVLDAVIATIPEPTPAIRERMAQLAASGPPVEDVGLEPFPTNLLEIGARR